MSPTPRAAALLGVAALSALLLPLQLVAAAMLAVAAALAVVVYQKFGVEMLRKAWVNLDLLWAAAFVAVGITTMFT